MVCINFRLIILNKSLDYILRGRPPILFEFGNKFGIINIFSYFVLHWHLVGTRNPSGSKATNDRSMAFFRDFVDDGGAIVQLAMNDRLGF